MIKIVLITPRLQHYRLSFYEKLSMINGYHLDVLYGINNNEDGKAGYTGETKFSSTGFKELKYRILPFEIVYNPGMYARIKEINPDMIIMLASTGNITYRRIINRARKKGRKIIIWTSGWDPGRAKGLLMSLKNSLVSSFYKKADFFLTYSTYANRYVESMGIDKSKIELCYNGIEIDDLRNDSVRILSESQEIIRKYNLEGHITFLYVGGLIPEKRADLLIDAFAGLREMYSNIKLMIIGDGPLKTMIEEKIRKLDDPNILFLGRIIRGVDPFFAASDCLVLPGAGGLALNQAMFWKKVCIVSKADGTEDDLVIEDVTGYRFRDNDPGSLISAMDKRINESYGKVQVMSENANRIILDKSNVNNMVNVFDRTIKSLILS